ncbi:hypothetical protein HB779_25230 (plasmid) [Phyllobacterium sp. 628]|uniref:hypothetical protein n=1 Tax=Phyllobacterium sp. 628 TaxID=2718938 RepID=UPI0016628942|nr:hypothetical protein [Phyllobacterium sp. 628]QND55159.1 hypothetical protein HB779_25230 [Phyllobacterium sp. 628]
MAEVRAIWLPPNFMVADHSHAAAIQVAPALAQLDIIVFFWKPRFLVSDASAKKYAIVD